MVDMQTIGIRLIHIDENQLTKNMDEEVVEQQLVKIGGVLVSGKAARPESRSVMCLVIMNIALWI